MDNNMKVSIIIPAYNAGETISKCIKSIQRQSYLDLEIICINDGSTDNTKNCVELLASTDSRIRLINQENSGPFVARKTGIQNCSGDYIMFVDADDELIGRTAIARLINCFLENQDVQIIQYGYKKFINPIIGIESHFPANRISFLELKEKYYCDYIGNSKGEVLSVTLWNKIYRADLVRKAVDCPDVRLKMGEDLYLLISIIFNANFCHMLNISNVFYKYNQYLGGSQKFDYTILNEYSLLKGYQNYICDTFELGFDAKFYCNLESVYYLMAVVYSMVDQKTPKNEVLAIISECDEYECIKYAKKFFSSITDSDKTWEELIFLSSEYSAEEYYNYIITHPRTKSKKKKFVASLKKILKI